MTTTQFNDGPGGMTVADNRNVGSRVRGGAARRVLVVATLSVAVGCAVPAPIALASDHHTLLYAAQRNAAVNSGDTTMAGLAGAGHVRDGAARQQDARSTTELVVCVRHVCNSKE